ncbi:histone deacetylase family protein [Teredinibacter franksiae]|uniref:histone deacetylase family protein n=1 Tax=Teredinibacter franksiae TaxID=2761453 RepID=UPI001623ED74|nr:histone deacetylase [Teredinibacter franksiae]
MKNRLVYSSGYDFSVMGLGKLHPFDAKKFSKAWKRLKANFHDLEKYQISPKNMASNELLELVHTPDYLVSLEKSSSIAQVIELGLLRLAPAGMLNRNLINPIRLATQGTRLAAEYAVKNQTTVMNLGGGYHHAFSDRGEGFCFFADAALAINTLKADGLLQQDDLVAMIDLDAHRGNGFESFFKNDPSVTIFDMYNFQVYPGMHTGDIDKFPFMVPLKSRTAGESYLEFLKEELPRFLRTLNTAKLVFYNAGSDILAGDPLGALNVSFEHVVERDRYVLEALKKIAAPTVVLTSGGYTGESHKLVAECAKLVLTD